MSFARGLVHHDSVDSTMRTTREAATHGAPHGTTHLAREQTQARGRHGHRWQATRDAGVWMTTILRPEGIDPARWPELALVAGVATQRAVTRLGAHAVRLKWPNDLVAREKKLGGLLLESASGTSAPFVLVGIGIDVAPSSTHELDPALRDHVIGLAELGVTATVPEVAAAVLDELEAWYADWAAHGVAKTLSAWRDVDGLLGRRVRFAQDGATLEGVAQGVNEWGELCVTTDEGACAVRAGEVLEVRAARGETR